MGTLAGVLGGYLAKRLRGAAARALGRLGLGGARAAGRDLIVGGGIVYVELILGELVPKALALRYTETVALLVPGRSTSWRALSHGLVVLLTASTRAVLLLFGIRDIRPARLRLRGGDQAPGHARAASRACWTRPRWS